MRLSTLGLRRLIGCLGLIGALAVAVLGGIYLAGNLQLGRYQAEADLEASLQERVLVLHNTLLAAHSVEKQYLLRSDARLAAEHETLLQGARAQAREVDGLLAGLGDDALHARFKPVLLGIEAYGRHFKATAGHRTILGLTPDAGLQGAFRASAQAAEKLLSDIDEKGLTNLLLQMRRSEKDFQLHGRERDAQAVESFAREFVRYLDTTSVTGSLYDALKGAVSAYGRDFTAYAERHLSALDEEQAANRAFRALEPVFTDIRGKVGARYRDAQQSIAEVRSRTTAKVLGAALAAFVLVGVLGFLIARAVVRPISALTRSTEALVQGDLSTPVTGVGRSDEIGTMARALQVFRDALAAKRAAEAAAAQEAEARSRRAERLDGLTRGFEQATGELATTLADAAARMQATAEAMSGTAAVSSREADAVAGTAERTSANVQAVASASEELAQSINEIADQVSASSRIAAQAAADARRTNETVLKLASGAQRIGAVVALINDIAAQTNLLALNATIEAARAGEAGRGFAVVASEVKALAGQTARATDEIGQQIQEIQAATTEAVAAIEGICGTVGSLDAVAGRIAATMEQQGSATQEISRNVQQAARGTGEVTESIGRMRQAAGDAGAAAAAVLEAAQAVSRHAASLNGEVAGFIGGVKRA